MEYKKDSDNINNSNALQFFAGFFLLIGLGKSILEKRIEFDFTIFLYLQVLY